MSPRPFACVLAVTIAAAAPAADTRNIFQFDGGSYEKAGPGKWVEKRGDKTFDLKEGKVHAPYVQLSDPARKLTVVLREASAEVMKEG